MSTPTKAAEIRDLAEKIWLNATSHGHGEPIASQAKAIIALLAEGENKGEEEKAAEIREALELANELVTNPKNASGEMDMRDEFHRKKDRALALLADMEREEEPVKVVTTIKGWVRSAGVDVHGPGYELGSGCGWCEFNEVGQPDHGDQPATLIIGTHQSPTTADAMADLERSKPQPSVEEVMGAWRKEAELHGTYSAHREERFRDRLTKLFKQ